MPNEPTLLFPARVNSPSLWSQHFSYRVQVISPFALQETLKCPEFRVPLSRIHRVQRNQHVPIRILCKYGASSVKTSNAHPWFADPFLKGLTWLLPVRLSKERNCMLVWWGECELRSVLSHLWSPLIFSWFILSKLRSIAIFSSSLYSDSESLYLNVKRKISLDAIHRGPAHFFQLLTSNK